MRWNECTWLINGEMTAYRSNCAQRNDCSRMTTKTRLYAMLGSELRAPGGIEFVREDEKTLLDGASQEEKERYS